MIMRVENNTKWIIFIIISIVSILIGVSIPNNPNPHVSTNKLDINVWLKSVKNNEKSIITIESNVPDNTEGIVTLEKDDINYRVNSPVKFKDGIARTNEFMLRGGNLPSGEYTMRFKSTLDIVQPVEVQNIIGKNYSNVQSKYIDESVMGRRILFTKKINI
ncbi:hypothetical protein Z954_08370 [Clostridium botulinum C/D str. BKT2873]|nr:hypothetical protein Z952_06890 [Clostridium botulinum C/D str. BKT75002]KEI11300.1 hypothetical protein Z954_08370 [Clostridium botulinum C/D str. BKT2873]QPW61807.1 hypothetical protein IG390_06520 [Clostridium botulinum]